MGCPKEQTVKAFRFEQILNVVLPSFSIRCLDFNQAQFRNKKERRIGGVARIDIGEIMTDENPYQAERDRTWLHWILSVYYYPNGVPGLDDVDNKEISSNSLLSSSSLFVKG